jgi:hypothetical protein
MPSLRGFSLLLTASQAAARLGVPIETVLGWAAAGRLQIAGQDEDGRALFREGVIDGVGEDLAALTPSALRFARKARRTRPDTERLPPLPCGCNLARSPFHLCPTGAALNAALQLAEMLAALTSGDPLLRKLAGLAREALTKHLVPPGSRLTVIASDTAVEMTVR